MSLTNILSDGVKILFGSMCSSPPLLVLSPGSNNWFLIIDSNSNHVILHVHFCLLNIPPACKTWGKLGKHVLWYSLQDSGWQLFLFSEPEGLCRKRSMRKLPCGRRTCFAYQNSSILNFPIIYPTFRPQDARNKHENERQVLRIAAQLHFPSRLGDDQENRWNMLGSCRKKTRFVQNFGPTRLVYGRYGESDVFFFDKQNIYKY